MRRTLLIGLGVGLLVAGCKSPPPRRATDPTLAPRSEGEPAEGDALRELARLSELVAVGEVSRRLERPEGVSYVVEVREVLVRKEAVSSAETHPAAHGAELKVTQFLYRPGRPMTSIGPLLELSRYLFFLAPADDPGEWLNLDDPALYPLPAAQETREQLRALGARRAAPPPGGGEASPAPDEPGSLGDPEGR